MSMPPWGYVALLGAFVLVMALALPRKKSDPEPAKSTHNMEIALEQFMENMESDNRELVDLVKRSQEDNAKQLALRESRIADLESRCADLEAKLEQVISLPAALNEAAAAAATGSSADALEQPADEPMARSSIRSRYTELFELYDEGKSIETVSRKLNMNKGEVQLIIQLAKQEEGARV